LLHRRDCPLRFALETSWKPLKKLLVDSVVGQ
jgi:hypothetical protein